MHYSTPVKDRRMTIIEFLEARIVEDERNNDADVDPVDWCDRVAGTHYTNARIAAECAAKREILELYRSAASGSLQGNSARAGMYAGLGEVVLMLAGVYKDHPDYPEWIDE